MQEINILLELDEENNLKFCVVAGNEAKILDPSNRILLDEAKNTDDQCGKCELCEHELSLKIFYSKNLLRSKNLTEKTDPEEFDLEFLQSEKLEPECIVLKLETESGGDLEIKDEILSEEDDFQPGLGADSETNTMDSDDSELPFPARKKRKLERKSSGEAPKTVRNRLQNSSPTELDEIDKEQPLNSGSNQKPFQCSQCNIGFMSKRNLRRHLTNRICGIARDPKPFECPKCAAKFADTYAVRRHLSKTCIKNQINDLPEPIISSGGDQKPYKCPKCGLGFVAKKNVKRHLQNKICIDRDNQQEGRTKKAVENCLTYLPKALNLPNLSTIQAPYSQVFEQPDGTKAFVTLFAKFGDIRVTNFDLNIMKCDLCHAPSHYISDLIGHRKHHHFFPNKADTCKGCSQVFKTSDEKRRHSYYCLGKDGILINYCEKCKFQASDWKDYRYHLDSIHKNDWYKNKDQGAPSQEFLCHFCSTVFKDKKHFHTHVLRHKDPKPYKCDKCQKAFVNRLAVWTHLIRVHFPEEAKYICKACDPPVLFCQAKPYMAHTRNIHLRAGEGPPKAPCPVCGKHLNKTFVKRHIQEAHGDPNQKPRFQCLEPNCGKLFLQKHYLELHSRIHLPDELKKFRCQFCNQGFHTKQNKIEHERSHTGEKPYECETCHKAFARKATFLDHQREHTGKGYTCSVCQKMYTDRGNFRHHMQQHEKHLGIRLTYTQEERRLMKMNLLSPQETLN